MARESTIRGGYASGYYKPMVIPMGSTAKSAQSANPSTPQVQTGAYNDESLDALALRVRNRQYNELKGQFETLLFAAAGLGATVVYLFVTRGRS